MSTETLVPCACCKDATPSSRLRLVNCLKAYVCQECRRYLFIADAALSVANIPPIHRGPFSGSSIG